MKPSRLRADARVLKGILSSALLHPYRPIIAHLVVTRRCNLSCGYCFEYDKVSPPVPLAVLRERIDHLARLRAVFVTLTGGEPLLHPLMRGGDGTPVPLDARAREVYAELQRMGRRSSAYLSEDFQASLLRDGEVSWKCRAGARFFHVCEHGLVHLCAPRTGNPGIPLADYGEEDLRRAFRTGKSCTARCPVAYAHQASRLDGWRSQGAADVSPPRRLLPVVR